MSFLQKVTAERRADARERAASGALEDAVARASAAPSPRSLARALGAPGISLIAEIKRASPSAGPISPGADHLAMCAAYEGAGASAISVLTEPRYFSGSLDDLTAVRGAVGLPVLRKDFICEPLHVWEARAAGADAILLIVAALTAGELRALMGEAADAGVDVLVEVHSPEEARIAADAGARIIGINTRDLATLEVDLGTVAAVRPSIPDGVVVVGESGISTKEDVDRMIAAGCDAILVGEVLMRAPDPADKVRELIGRG